MIKNRRTARYLIPPDGTGDRQLHMWLGSSSADEVAYWHRGWTIKPNGDGLYLIRSNCQAGECLCAGEPDNSKQRRYRHGCSVYTCHPHEQYPQCLWRIVPVQERAENGPNPVYQIVSSYSGNRLYEAGPAGCSGGRTLYLLWGLEKHDKRGHWEIHAPPSQVCDGRQAWGRFPRCVVAKPAAAPAAAVVVPALPSQTWRHDCR